jgi:type I restriction enzyme S subunit
VNAVMTTPDRSTEAAWPRVRLGDVCRVVGGSTPKTGIEEYWSGDIVWVTPSDLGQLQSDRISSSGRFVTRLGYDSCGAEIVPPGSVVMSSRAPIGHLAIAGVPLCTNQGCKTFVPGPHVDSEFLFYRLRQAVPHLRALGSGATFAEVSKRQCELFEIPLPPLTEQRRIADALRGQLNAAARMRAAAERQAEALKRLKLSAIDRAFGVPPSEWPTRPIGELARVLSGYAFKSAWFSDQGVRLLRNANVSQEGIDWTETVLLPEKSRAEFTEYELNEGDIVLALDRPVVAAGLKVARLVEADIPSLLLQRVATFRLSEGLDAGYLYAFLRTSAFLNAISGHEQSLGVPHVSPRQVAAVRLPVPTVAVQRDIVCALDSELRLAGTVASGLAEQAADIGRLPAALLRSAFSGDSPDNL